LEVTFARFVDSADRGGSAAGATSVPQAITVVLNWQSELKQRVPTR
jgi:hypothetical protein